MNYLINCYKNFEKKILIPNSETEFNLIAFRFFYCIALAVRLIVETKNYSLKFESSIYYFDHSFLTLFGAVEKPSFSFFLVLHVTSITAFILLAFGIKSRLTALIAAFTFTWANLIYYGMHLIPSSKYVYHTLNIIPFILIGLAVITIAPVKKNMSEYLTVRRSNTLYTYIVILICYSYTAAFLNRLFTMPVQWFSGEFLSNTFVHYGYLTGLESTQRLGTLETLCMVMSWGTAIFEIGCWVLLFQSKFRFIFVIIGIIFHLTIKWSGLADFVDWFGFSYLIFIPYSRIALSVNGLTKRLGWSK